MKTLLLCGYRPSLGLDRSADGRTMIERRISELHEYGSPALCVLSGAFADDQLRACPRLSDVEISYDNGAPSLASNVRSGLEDLGGREPCLVMPLEVPLPERATWNRLLDFVENSSVPENTSLIQAVTAEGAPWHFGFPLVVTRFGLRELQRLQDLKSLADPRVKYLLLPL